MGAAHPHLTPGPLRGRVRVPGDKSIGHRALMLASIAHPARTSTTIEGLPTGADVRSTIRCLRALGVTIEETEDTADGTPTLTAVVTPPASGRLEAPAEPLDCGNSGTTMRLLCGLLAGQRVTATLIGDASLSARPMARVVDPLREIGVPIHAGPTGRPPIVLGNPDDPGPLPAPRGGSITLRVPSAQVKGALLLAGLGAVAPLVVHDPHGTRDHTERMLVQWTRGQPPPKKTAGRPLAQVRLDVPFDRPGTPPSARTIELSPGAVYSPGRVVVPGDPSSAFIWAAAATIIPGSRVELPGVLWNATRASAFGLLIDHGADITAALAPHAEPAGSSGEPVADLTVATPAARLAPIRADRIAGWSRRLPGMIDETPLVALVATQARGRSVLTGLAELLIKESDRLSGAVAILGALGANVRSVTAGGQARLVVVGPADLAPLASSDHFHAAGDHRLVMLAAIATQLALTHTHGLATLPGHDEEGTPWLSALDRASTDISYPTFWDDLDRLTRQPLPS